MDFISIGRITKPIGARGEVKILPLTPDTQRFMNLPVVWLGHYPADAEAKKILKVRIDATHVVVKFDGIETIEDAEKIKNFYLFISKKDVVTPEQGCYFIDDVIGCEVVTEERMVVGTVSDIFSLPMNDIWVVIKGTKEILIPAVKAVIRQVNIENKRITIHAFDGLID